MYKPNHDQLRKSIDETTKNVLKNRICTVRRIQWKYDKTRRLKESHTICLRSVLYIVGMNVPLTDVYVL